MDNKNSNSAVIGAIGIILVAGIVFVIIQHLKKPAAPAANAPAATPVTISPVRTGSIEQITSVTGSLSSLNQTDLSAKIAGRVISVAVHEGDPVSAGEVIVQLDPSEQQATVMQDQANVENAQAKLAQANTQYQQSIVNANVAVQNAKSVLAEAKVNLQKTITGDQQQEKEQAKDQVMQQQANYDNAAADYAREQQLYDQGAAAKMDLDNSKTQYEAQKALLDSYKQALDMALQGGRTEDIQAAQQVVDQDQLALENQIANLANVKVNRDAIVADQAAVAQARATLSFAQTQLAEMTITSPVNGFVSKRSTDPGSIANPGTALITIVDLHTVYYQPTVSDVTVSAIHNGDPVNVAVDSFPGRTFNGSVTAVYPSADPSNPVFSVRVSIPNPDLELKPGMYARGSIVTELHRGVVLIPVSTLVPRDQSTGYSLNLNSSGTATGSIAMPPQKVFLYNNGKAEARNVEIGIIQDQNVEITSGLEPGDKLIVTGEQTLQDGDPVSLPGASSGNGKPRGASSTSAS